MEKKNLNLQKTKKKKKEKEKETLLWQEKETLLWQQKSLYSSYGFSSSHAWMWELGYKESWAPKNWCFRIVVLEKTLESPLES